MDIDSVTDGRWMGEMPCAGLQPGTMTARGIPGPPLQRPGWLAAQQKDPRGRMGPTSEVEREFCLSFIFFGLDILFGFLLYSSHRH